MKEIMLREKNGALMLTIGNHILHGPRLPEFHTHPYLEISCVPSGTGTYHVDGQDYDVRAGDVFLFNNSDSHGLEVPAGVTLNNLVIHFDPSFIWNSLSNAYDYNFLLIFFERGKNFTHRLDRENPATQRIYNLMMEIYQEFLEQRLCYELIVKIKLQTIFAESIRHYDYIDEERVVKPLHESDIAQLNAVLSYIDEHLDDDIRLAQLAAIAHVSPAYFSTLFKRFNGLTPVEFIVHKRIQRAIEYIRTTDKNLTEIATLCGFNNSTNFYKAFRKVTGRTPISYRLADTKLISEPYENTICTQ